MASPVIERSRPAAPSITVDFAPGSYWTPARAAGAAADATAAYENGGREQLEAWSRRYAAAHTAQATHGSRGPRALRLRRGEIRDIVQVEALLAASDLPPMFVAEFIRGFVVAESEIGVLACGGLEPYGRSGIVRSVAVAEEARGLGLGRRVAALLIADAELSGLLRLFLSASDAAGFWSSLGFRDRALADWPEETRVAWQYRFFSEHREFVRDISLHTMERSLAA